MDEVSKENNKTLRKIQAKFVKVINKYGLIEDEDHILIGLSGGKDSLALVELLGERMKMIVPRFKLTAVHISVENIPYQSDLEYLETFSNKFGIPFVHHITHYDGANKTNKSTCFQCSWQRRKALFEVAEKLHCNKIALGHHLDDIAETLLLNMIFQGTFGSMPPKLKLNKFDMTIIRPLALILESELLALERIRNFKKQIKNCPFEKDSSRTDAKNLMKELEKMNPNIRENLWAAMENVKAEYLPVKA